MPKESGLGATLSIDNSAGALKDISNDCTNVSFTTPRGIQDTTGLDSSTRETLLLLADFSFTANGVFNDATDMSHDVFKTVSSTSVARSWQWDLSGQNLDTEVNLTDYSLNRSQGGEFTWTVPGVLESGLVTWT